MSWCTRRRGGTHLHYFVDTPATAAGTVIPAGDPTIIHSGVLTQDLGTLAAGSHTVVVVVGQLDHRACDLRGTVTFTTPTQVAPTATAAAVAPPKTGSAGFAGGGAVADSGWVIIVLGGATLLGLAGARVIDLAIAIGGIR